MRPAEEIDAIEWLDRGFTLREKIGLGLEVVRAYGRARWLLWRTDLPTAVATLRASTPRATADAPHVLLAGLRLGQVVSRVLGPLPFDSRCLMRSLVLVDLLATRRVYTVLVVAVASEPGFRAHAWVEHDHVALLEPAGEPFARLVEL